MSDEKNQININKINVITGALQLSVLFMPAFFINDLLSYKDETGIFTLFIIPVFLGICSCIAVLSGLKREAVLKCLISLPFSVIMWLYLINIEFGIRSLNWVYPDYGESSAGGNFAGFIRLCIHIIAESIGIAVGFFISNKKLKDNKALFIIQKIICSVICVGIIIAVLLLNVIMPQYNPVYG